jgi:Ig-like domain from next to BRCA1 gene
MRKLYLYLIMILLIALVGCNLPGAQLTPTSPGQAFTQAAETVEAELTQVSSQASPTPMVPTDTATPINTNTAVPTNTPAFTPTNTPIPCNLASFVTDVTYPDNTHVAPGQTFTKTWRIRNIGSCSWNSSYLLIFDHGDGIGVTSGYTQQLTSGVVNQGQTVDLTVNLTAPGTPGTYTGYWRFRDPGGVLFGITPEAGSFIVKVIVVATKTVTLTPVISESGSVRSDGDTSPDITVGDSVDNFAVEALISYDISGIPSNAIITQVQDNFKTYTVTGNPFGHLGVLNGYKMDYIVPLAAGDYVSGFTNGNVIDWGSTGILDVIETQTALKPALQSKVGSKRFKLRLQFAGTNHDGIADFITFANPSLIITYTTP